MAITDTGRLLQFNLTNANQEEIIDVETQLNLQTPREFIISGDFGGATLKIQKYLSDNTGWVDYVNPATQEVIAFSSIGAGYGITFYQKIGKIKFILENSSGSTDIKIDLIK